MPAHKAHDGTSWVNLAKSGRDGQAVLSGSGVPAPGLGKVGDFYIDKPVSNIYGPKTSGGWGSATSLIGAPSSLYDANTMLAANVDNTPLALTVPASTIVGRAATGNIAALSAATVRSDFDLAQLSTVGNLLTANQASGTDTLGDTTGFSAGACILTSTATSPGHGTRSLRVVGTGAVPSVYLGSTATPLDGNSIRVVNPNAPMTFFGRVRSETGTTTLTLRCYWFDATGTLITSSSYPPAWTVTSTWADYQSTIMPPSSSAAYVVLRLYQTLATDIFELDKLGAWAGAGGDWAMPGTPITNLGTKVSHPNIDDVLVQRWDSSKAVPGWQRVLYDSGWRDYTAAAIASSDPVRWRVDFCRIRRVNEKVSIRVKATKLTVELKAGASAGIIFNLPQYWHPDEFGTQGCYAPFMITGNKIMFFQRMYISPGVFAFAIIGSSVDGNYAVNDVLLGDATYTLNSSSSEAIPTSLPGTLSAAAPA